MKHWIIVFVCLICLLFVGYGTHPQDVSAAGNTYYVATTGSDTNDGSFAHPWLTPKHASQTVVAGDTVYIMAGTYTGTGGALFPTHSGSAGNYITFQNYNGGVVNLGGQIGLDYGNIDVRNHDYINFIGLRCIVATTTGVFIQNAGYITLQNLYITASATCGIKTENADNLIIDGCEVYNVNSSGANECVSLMPATNFVVKNCHFHHSASGRIMFDIKDGCQNGYIYDNEIDHALTYEGIYVDGMGYAQDNINIYRNKIHDNAQYGIAINNEEGTQAQTNINIYNNLIYNNTAAGFFVYNTQAYTTTFKFINNTLYNNWRDGWAELQISKTVPDQMTGSVIRNNIIVSTHANSYGFWYPNWSNDLGDHVAIDHNLFYNSGGSWHSGVVYGYDYQTGNPLLANPPISFLIGTGSAAINTGSATGAPATDYAGAARPQGSGYDIGAYEGNNAAPSITTSSLPNGTVGVAYSQTLAATGGTAPYTWAIASGTLPAGLGLSSSGVISGTPTTVGGPNSVTFQVTDSTSATATKTLSITINAAAPSITTSALPNGTVGVAYSQTLAVTGDTAPYTWTIASGTLPAGLSLSSSGVISGTPTVAGGPTSITFQVTDGTSATATKTLSITVAYADWDVNMDGSINVLDMISVGQHWGETGSPAWIRQDINADGVVNVLDNIVVGQHWTE
jgi:hypothetical protein